MWTPATREQYRRVTARYQSDLTDEEWLVIEPLLPPAKPTGRPRAWPMREIVNAVFYVLRGGIAWRLLPSDFPPWATVYRWFAAWRDGCVFEKMNHALVMAARERIGREASPSAAILDSQSVKTTEAGGPRGYDAGKKINGRKRHALVDTDGRALIVEPHPASIQDRDGGGPLLAISRRLFPFIERVFADAGYDHEPSPPPRRSSSRSSTSCPIRSASPSSRGAGWSNGSSHGSAAIEGSPRTSRRPSPQHAPSSTPLPSCCSPAVSPKPHEFRNRLLVSSLSSAARFHNR
jgi:putative transposase